jgi:hypothetical protein
VIQLNFPNAALKSKPPTAGSTGTGCDWTAEELANWKGPYMNVPATDAWGLVYRFDPYYAPYSDPSTRIAVVMSRGPNKTTGASGAGDSDDIYLLIN